MKQRIGAGTVAFAGLRSRKRAWLIAAGLILALCGLVYAAYFQSFKTETAGWNGNVNII